jgi:mono/diheme cytochrome c family protein
MRAAFIMKTVRSRWFPIAALLLAGSAGAAAPDFNRDVRPLLEKHCLLCHGPGQQMAGLRFDRPDGASRVIVPGDASASRVVEMVTTGRDGKVMPPVGPRLSADEVSRLRAWIDAGAVWPADAARIHWAFQAPRRPELPRTEANPVDSFVLARLQKEGIASSPGAAPATLIRRASLDITGLLPTEAELEAFAADHSPQAYEHLIDRLLASPHYGEKWARHWLDLARYADSDGYEQDSIRLNAWRYRDWVIRALNRNMRFDEFTIEQIAGDLLPGATVEQRAATGFHRNTLTSREGGIDVEQLRDEQVMDRTNTIGTVWLGLTIECARCHDHKYDPISQRDYYQLFAFLNGAEEVNLPDPVPDETGPYQQKLPEYQKKLAGLLARYRIAELQPRWEKELLHAMANPEERLEWTQNLDYVRVYLDHGWEVLKTPPEQRTWKQAHGLTRVFLKSPGPLGSSPEMKALKFSSGFQEFEALDAAYPQLSEIPAIAEMANPPRTFVHLRGDFRSPGDEAHPDTPAVLPALPKGPKHDRMALARWLVSADNPLTARVAVNRMWQELFGKGIVATSEDFGIRSDPPSHPELLDWLACEFVQSGWDVKHMLKLMMMSATYRQSSHARPELEQRDPGNRLLARQNRLRLPAELIRDAMLQASGLINLTIGGRSVRPPMPAALVKVAYRARWEESTGPDRYRRGLYTFFQRSIPYPQLMLFDAPNSLVTCPRRERSTTPLQALELLDDPVFFEGARAMASRVLRDCAGCDFRAKLNRAYRLALARDARPDELAVMSRYYDAERTRQDETAAWTALSSVLLNLDEFITRE